MENKHHTAITLAVFPFENLTVGNSLAIFCRSFSIDLITELSRFNQFQIIAEPSVSDLEPANGLHDHPHDRFHSDYNVQGSFRNDKGMVRINVQLYNSHTNRLVWADRFEGELNRLQEIQEDLHEALVSSLQHQLNYDLLSVVRRKPKVELRAYECWLYGLDELKKGSLESDIKAREYFQQAIEIEPDYSLAYSGMSLTYFNEWSCQLWDRWEVSQTGAFEWAKKALELDDQNYVALYVLGRLYLYEGAYESAEHYLRKSLLLNANDPDSLIQIASCLTFLGYATEAFQLYEKVLRINPAKAAAYCHIGGFILFEMGDYEQAISQAIHIHTGSWVDQDAFFAATHYHLGDYEKMEHFWQRYLQTYEKIICKGHDCTPLQAVEWMSNVNPFKGNTNLQPFWEFISKGNYSGVKKKKEIYPGYPALPNQIQKDGDLWKFTYDGMTVHLAEVKGFFDLQKLLARPRQGLHCAELMGSVLTSDGEALFDEKARKAYQKEILDLQREIEAAESSNDFESLHDLQKDYDQMIDHLSRSLGLKGKIRQAGNPIEKARSAITWRIRNAIAKIEKVHSPLGGHLSNAIKTGIFCTYQPEQDTPWNTD